MAKHLDLTDEQYEELRRTGGPLIVRTDEGSDVVIQDLAAYRRTIEVLDEIDVAESARICEERWKAMQSGDGISAEEMLADVRRRLRDVG